MGAELDRRSGGDRRSGDRRSGDAVETPSKESLGAEEARDLSESIAQLKAIRKRLANAIEA